jgi:ParB-like chromosome segregation protein Spo0J
MIEQYKEHPIAAIFPMITEPEFDKLKADIKAHGFKEPGLLFEGKVLDGRNRYRASRELGIEMNWAEVENSEPEDIAAFDPVAYVLSQNLHRRHLKQSQRAMIAAKMATLTGSGRPEKGSNDTFIADAAALLSVSEPTVKRAKHVLANGCKQLIEAVEACEITVSMAEKLCKTCDDKKEQAKLVKEGKKAIAEALPPSKGQGKKPKADCSLIEAFAKTENKLQALRQIIDALEPYEAAMVRDMAIARLN